MADDIRIKDLQSTASYMESDDYLGIDSLASGTRKINFAGLMDSEDDRLPTTDKTPRGAIDEHEGDISEIKQSLSNLLTIKSITVSHGTINAGQASTITDARLKNENIIICSISVGGSYNSDCIPWSYYGSANGFVSRLKNTGSNQATNIVVTYRYIELP